MFAVLLSLHNQPIPLIFPLYLPEGPAMAINITRWEYSAMGATEDVDLMKRLLREAGAGGWELCGPITKLNSIHGGLVDAALLIFKRPIPHAAPD
jgi:hypothetical protein